MSLGYEKVSSTNRNELPIALDQLLSCYTVEGLETYFECKHKLSQSDKYFLFLVIEVNSKSEYSYTLSFNRLEFTLNFKFNSLNINSKRFFIGAEIKNLNVLRKLLLLLLNLLIFYSHYLRQVVACGSKSATGRDFNADMKSEIS